MASNPRELQDESLRVFVSSTMAELKLVRSAIAHELKRRGIAAWVYERQAHPPNGKTIVQYSLECVDTASAYLGVFKRRLGEVTRLEFERARQRARKPGIGLFVCILKNVGRRDRDLEAFLAQEVRDPGTGVVYIEWPKDELIELGEEIATRIFDWLLRRHKELLAEVDRLGKRLETTQDSVKGMVAELEGFRKTGAEVERTRQRLKRTQRRLKRILQEQEAARREYERLGKAAIGPAPTEVLPWLKLQASRLLDSLGYDVEQAPPAGENRFELLLRGKQNGNREPIVLHGVEGEAEFGDLAALRDAVRCHRAAEGWLLSPRRASPAAQAEARDHRPAPLRCLSLDDLIDEHAHFDRYFQWLEREIQDHRIDHEFVALACVKLETDPATGEIRESRYGQGNGWIHGYMDRWLADPSRQHVSVLGEFGTGKTWFSMHYAWTMLKRYRDAKAQHLQRPRLPLIVRLRSYPEAGSIDGLLSRFFLERFEVGISLRALKQLNAMGKMLLILDGFDEMAAKCHREDVIRHFWDMARVVVPGSKVVLTCRAEHFLNAREGRDVLTGEIQVAAARTHFEPPRFDIVTLEVLDDDQVRTILTQRSDEQRALRVMSNPELLRHARRPVLTDFILEALPSIEDRAEVDLAHIYLYAVRRKLERDVRQGDELPFRSLADKVFFFCELSWEMLRTGRMTLKYDSFPATLSCWFGRGALTRQADPWQQCLERQGLLTRDDDGYYTPTHRSLIEFFSAYKLVNELGVMEEGFLELIAPPSEDRPEESPTVPGPDCEHARCDGQAPDPAGDQAWFSPRRTEPVEAGKGGPPGVNSWVARFCRRSRGGAWKDDDCGSVRPGVDCPATRAFVLLDRLTPTATKLAVQMVSPRPEAIRLLCEIAHHGRGYHAWNAQTLLPLFPEDRRRQIALLLVEQCGDGPAPSGLAWAFGELHVRDDKVLDLLNRTVDAYRMKLPVSSHAWWQASFSLMKLGYLGGATDRNFKEPVERLVRALPDGWTLDGALASLARCLTADHPDQWQMDERDIVRIADSCRSGERGARQAVERLLDQVKFPSDEHGHRVYFSIWLCGYLRLAEFVPKILAAIRYHPHGSVRTCAAEALGKIGDFSKEVIQALERLLQSNYYRARFHAARSLGDLEAVGSIGVLETAARWEEVDSVKAAMLEVAGRLAGLTRGSPSTAACQPPRKST